MAYIQDVILNFVVKAKGTQSLGFTEKQFGTIRHLAEQAKMPVGGFIDQLSRTNFEVNKAGMLTNKLSGQTVKHSRAISDITKRTRGFRMELLSVMFFGFGVSAVMGSLLQPAMEAAGVFDVFRATLEVGFLPTGLAVLQNVMLPFMDWFLSLPEWMQAGIGGLVLFAQIGGGLLGTFGSLGLGLQGLAMAFPSLGMAVSAAGGGIMGVFKVIGAGAMGLLANPVVLAIVAIIAIIVLLYMAFKNNWFGFRDIVMSVWNALQPVFKIIMDVINTLGAIFGKVFQGIVAVLQFFWNIAYGIISFIANLIRGFIERLVGHEVSWQDIWNGIVKVLQFAWSIMKPIFDAIGAALDWLAKLFKPIFDAAAWFSQNAGELGRNIGRGGAVPGTAAGGIVTRPQVRLVGEAGPEAIIPLSKLPDAMSTNITINATVSSDVDIRSLGRRIAEVQAQELRSLLGR